MGLFGSLFGSKSKTKNTNEQDPWDQVVPYLTGDAGKGISGIFPDANAFYQQGGFNPKMQQGIDFMSGIINERATDPMFKGAVEPGNKAILGGFDPQLGGVRDVSASNLDLNTARQGQGPLDPTQSLSSLLSGRVNNPYLDQQTNAMIGSLTRNLNENVMPGIRSDAIMSGQYGGSRQGIAEGLAASRLNQDLAPAITSLYGGAHENAQNRMMGVAGQLNDQAYNNATNNVNRDFAGQQFNSNLDLQRNQQEMQRQGQMIGNRQAGLNMLGQGLDMQNSIFDQYMGIQQMPQQIDWNNLNNYTNLMYQGAGLGGQGKGTGTQTSSPGIVPAVLGTAAGIAGIGRLGGMWGGR